MTTNSVLKQTIAPDYRRESGSQCAIATIDGALKYGAALIFLATKLCKGLTALLTYTEFQRAG
jgi:hypothetical protein